MAAWIFLATAFWAGLILPFQAGINAQLARFTGNPLWAAFCSFFVGTVALALIALIGRVPLPSLAQLSQAPAWAWIGGFIGAGYVAAAVVLAPRLGAANLIALTVAGQLIGSLLIDHFALAGFSVHSISLWRLVGAAIMLVGMFLILKF